MITLAVLIFLLAAGMIAFKWNSTSEPSAS
jgi:hypothetical protein